MSTASSTASTVDRDFINGRYRVLKELGRGGMGQVYLVEDEVRDGQRMALKTLLPESTDDMVRAGFRDEFAELAKVRHPNLAAAFDFGHVTGTRESFFTTEFIDGVELMKGVKNASVTQLTQVTAQFLHGLDFLHDLELIHNDLKPANILLENESAGPSGDWDDEDSADLSKLESLAYGRCGCVKIIDFGLICREHTQCEKILGTVRYMSPERIQRAPADRRSDLYSAGVVIFTLFARRLPFQDKDLRELLRKHVQEPPPPLESLRRDLPPVIPQIVHRLLEKRPENRFNRASEVLDLLGRSLGWHDAPEVSRWNGKRLSAGSLLHRSKELEELEGYYDAARAGKGVVRSVTVEGCAGTGKSRLVEELRSHVQVSGGAYVTASGTAVEGNLQPIMDMLLAGLRTTGVSGMERIDALLKARESESVPLNNSLEKLVLLCTKQLPLVLHLDDFDRASDTVRRWALELVHTIEYRARRGKSPRKLLIVLTRRTVPGRGSVHLGTNETIELSDFAAPEAKEFVHRLFQQDEIPPAVVESLVRSSRGNPLFLTELANTIVESGDVTYSGATWRFPDAIPAATLPESLGDLFEERLAALKTDRMEVLHWVGTSRSPLSLGVLRRCVNFGDEALDAILAELLDKNLLSPNSDDESPVYSLSHAGSREMLDGRLNEGRRRLLHQRLAQNIEDEYPDDDDRADELAEHWLAAGNEAGFLRFAPRAAALLRERGDFERAVDYHRRLVEAMPDTAVAKKIQSLSKLCEMHEMRWDLQACIAGLVEIERLGEQLMRPADRALLLRRLAGVQIARHHNTAAENFLAKAERLLPENAPPFVRLSVEAPRAWALWFTGDHARAREILDRCLDGLDRTEPRDPRERMLRVGAANQLASMLHYLGDLDAATRLYEENLENLVDLGGQDQALAATRCALGGLLLDRGRFAAAVEQLKPAMTVGKTICDHRTLARARERFGDYHLRCGKFREALQITQAGLQDAETLNNSAAIASNLRMLGRIYVFANELTDARRVLERSVEIQRESKDVLNSVLSSIHLARLQLEEGEIDSARQILAQCEKDARRHELPLLHAQANLWLFVAQWRGQRHYNETMIATARKLLVDHGFVADTIDCLMTQLEVAIEARRNEECEALFAEIEERTAADDMPDQRGELRYLRALQLFEDGATEEAAKVAEGVSSRARNENRLRLCADAAKLSRRAKGLAKEPE